VTDTTSPAGPGMLWRRARFASLVTILVLLVVYSGLDWWSGRQLDNEVARFEAKYGSLSGPSTASNPPPADNRARLVRAAAALVNAPQESLDRAVTELQDPKSTMVVNDDRLALVNGSQDALRFLAGLESRRESRWDEEPGPQLLEIRQLGNLVYLSALIDVAEGRADQAADRAVEALDVSNSLANEPTLIAQLIRTAVGFQPLDVTQRLLAQAEPSRAALDKLAQRLAECRQPEPMGAGLLGEATNVNLALARAESGRRSADSDLGPLAGPLGRLTRPLLRLARTSYLAQMGRFLDLQAGPRPRPTGSVLPQPRWWSPVDRLVWTVMPGLERAIETGDDFSAALAGAEIAVALRRYRLEAGAYPDRLAALVPAYLDAVPIDPFTGAPPMYARQAGGFSLHTGRRPYRPLADWIVTK
jgi:hypothetical protein